MNNIINKLLINKFVIPIVASILLILFGLLINTHDNSKKLLRKINELELSYDSIYIINYYDKGILNAKVNILTTENFNNINIISNQKEIIERLNNTIKDFENKNSKLITALIISNSINITYKDSIQNIIIYYDSILENNIVTIYPTYSKDIDMFEDWITGNIKLGYKTSDINLNIRSEYDISLYRQRKNIFSKYELYANCKVLNPYDKTTDFLVVSKDELRKRFNISLSTGYGVYPFGHSVFIGITGGMTLITF
jgi:hypothetical protein